MKLSKQEKISLRHFLYREHERISALINDYEETPSDVNDLKIITTVILKLEKDLK